MHWPFANNPLAVLPVILLLSVLAATALSYRSKSAGWLVAATLLWVAYGAWELYCTARGYNIRVDLLVLCWLLPAITAILLVSAVVKGRTVAGVVSKPSAS